MQGLMMKYFTLNPSKKDAYGHAARAAMLTYAQSIEATNDDLAKDLRSWVNRESPKRNQEPPIGTELDGGIYAGLTLHDGRPHQFVLLPGEKEEITWKDATAWAEKQSGTLPSRIDQLVLWQNLKSEFKEAWYWSGEQHAGDESYAWYQTFYDGSQDYGHKLDELRARAVRRIEI
jgi:hypothetical protein